MKALQTFICVAVLGGMGLLSIIHVSVPGHALTETETEKLFTGRTLIEVKSQITRSPFDLFSKTYPKIWHLNSDGLAYEFSDDREISQVKEHPDLFDLNRWYIGHFFCIRPVGITDSDRCYSVFREGNLYRFEYRCGGWGCLRDTRFSEKYWFAIK